MLIENCYNAPLSQAIQVEYSKLVHLIAQVPVQLHTQKVIEGTGGKVSVADLVAYQIGWGTLLISWYHTGIAGKTPAMPGEGFATWDYVGLAHLFYSNYHFDGAQEQDQQLHSVVRAILAIVETEFQTGNLDKLGIWQWCTLTSGKQWPLSKWIKVNTVAPYKRARTLIRGLLRG